MEVERYDSDNYIVEVYFNAENREVIHVKVSFKGALAKEQVQEIDTELTDNELNLYVNMNKVIGFISNQDLHEYIQSLQLTELSIVAIQQLIATIDKEQKLTFV